MKREIKFRGREHFGKWLIGSLLTDNSTYWYIETPFFKIKVDGETVGQFTGLTDKNGKEIYEGDTVRILYSDWPSKSDSDERTLHQYLNDIAKIGEVVYDGFQFGIAIHSDKFNEDIVHSPEHGQYGFIEVIVKEQIVNAAQ